MHDENDDAPNLHVVREVPESRFYIVHGMIHDRVTGRYVTTAPDEEIWMGGTITSTCELLNELAATLTIEDYEQVLRQHARNVRRLDVALNGEDGAARAPLLIDILAQVEDTRRKSGHPVLQWPPAAQIHLLCTMRGTSVLQIHSAHTDKAHAQRTLRQNVEADAGTNHAVTRARAVETYQILTVAVERP